MGRRTGASIAPMKEHLTPCCAFTTAGSNGCLKHEEFTLGILLITIAVNIYLLVIVPKGFFPLGDNGNMKGGIRASQDISFQAMQDIT